jgi:hypothetical protein
VNLNRGMSHLKFAANVRRDGHGREGCGNDSDTAAGRDPLPPVNRKNRDQGGKDILP